MRYFLLGLLFLVVITVAIAGFRGQKFSESPVQIIPDMDDQPKVLYQASSEFFSDGRGGRMPVEGTIPYGSLSGDDYYDTGTMGERWGNGIPVTIDEASMSRGQERYGIYCAVCHGATGGGNGIVTEYGLVGVANFHTNRFREMPDGQIFNTITQGKGLMKGYGSKISREDRWAIVAYLRALQRSQQTGTEDVPESEMWMLNPYE